MKTEDICLGSFFVECRSLNRSIRSMIRSHVVRLVFFFQVFVCLLGQLSLGSWDFCFVGMMFLTDSILWENHHHFSPAFRRFC